IWVMASGRPQGGRGRTVSASSGAVAESLPMVLVERRDGACGGAQGEPEGEGGERSAGQHLLPIEDRGHRDAGGGQLGDQGVALMGGDGSGNGALHLFAPSAALVEAEACQLAEPDMGTETGPEVLLV